MAVRQTWPVGSMMRSQTFVFRGVSHDVVQSERRPHGPTCRNARGEGRKSACRSDVRPYSGDVIPHFKKCRARAHCRLAHAIAHLGPIVLLQDSSQRCPDTQKMQAHTPQSHVPFFFRWVVEAVGFPQSAYIFRRGSGDSLRRYQAVIFCGDIQGSMLSSSLPHGPTRRNARGEGWESTCR